MSHTALHHCSREWPVADQGRGDSRISCWHQTAGAMHAHLQFEILPQVVYIGMLCAFIASLRSTDIQDEQACPRSAASLVRSCSGSPYNVTCIAQMLLQFKHRLLSNHRQVISPLSVSISCSSPSTRNCNVTFGVPPSVTPCA